MLLDAVPYLSKLDPASLVGLLVVFLLPFLLSSFRKSPFLLINGKRPFEFKYTKARLRFLGNGQNLVEAGLKKASVFRIVCENGIKICLAPKYANEIRSHHALNFGASIARDFHTNVRGFEPFKLGTTRDEVIQDAVRMKLTQSLGNLTVPLSNEASVVLENIWTDNAKWHDISLKTTILQIVAQLSSRVFLGAKICRNPDWLRITVNYTIDSFLAAEELRLWPKIIRPLVANFLPRCQIVRKELDEARGIITPILEERRAVKEAAIRDGKKPERYSDAMEWMEECAKGRSYDPAMAQLSISVAAIHTTSDLLTQVLLDICGRDGLIQELRQEIITVVKEEGWKKATLYKLKLMDSVVKESQRLKPISVVSMKRLAEEDIKLSDGTIIPKGETIFVSGNRMWDPTVYPDPMTFDPYRFLKLRETPGHETSAQLVSPSVEHMAFGYGKHACPGRFFAANEVKIALCHILLKYDFRLAEGCIPKVRKIGLGLNADPFATVSIRRREEELHL